MQDELATLLKHIGSLMRIFNLYQHERNHFLDLRKYFRSAFQKRIYPKLYIGRFHVLKVITFPILASI